MALNGKKALVTGASSGIGLAIAKHLRAEGAMVCATGRNEEALKALAEEIGCTYAVGDLTEEGVCKRIVEEAVSQLGGLTTLVNNAGVLQVITVIC